MDNNKADVIKTISEYIFWIIVFGIIATCTVMESKGDEFKYQMEVGFYQGQTQEIILLDRESGKITGAFFNSETKKLEWKNIRESDDNDTKEELKIEHIWDQIRQLQQQIHYFASKQFRNMDRVLYKDATGSWIEGNIVETYKVETEKGLIDIEADKIKRNNIQ